MGLSQPPWGHHLRQTMSTCVSGPMQQTLATAACVGVSAGNWGRSGSAGWTLEKEQVLEVWTRAGMGPNLGRYWWTMGGESEKQQEAEGTGETR